MLKKTIIIILALIAFLLGYAATKPDNFSIQRTISIKAPAEKIFPLINDFHNWIAWSPFEKLDPAMKRAYSGATSGPGAVYTWNGNAEAEQGRMEIASTSPPSIINIKLDFFKPFKANNIAEFTLENKGDYTNVSWTMLGKNQYLCKVMQIFMSMDKMVGTSFETGLANLKTIAEK